MSISSFNSWRDVSLKSGFVASLLTAAFLIWMYSDDYIMTPAEAMEDHHQMIGWQLDDVRRQIEDLEIRKVETKYRAELQPQVRDELMAGYEIKLKRLRKSEKCLEGGSLRCE